MFPRQEAVKCVVDLSATQKPANGIGSVDNALRLLLLIQERGELRLSDVAAELGVANSTAHRLLATLAHRGFVVQQHSRAYRRGPALIYGAPHTLGPTALTLVHAHLLRLSEVTRETAHFVVLEGNGARFLDGVHGPEALWVGTRIGMLLPAHENSGGKALLARLTGTELRTLYPRGLPGRRSTKTTDLASLTRELAATRRRGYGINSNESAPGVNAVGRHVSGPGGTVFGALVVAAPNVRCPHGRLSELARQLAEIVKDLEADLSSELSAAPPAGRV